MRIRLRIRTLWDLSPLLLLAKHLSPLRFVRRHPDSFFERPTKPAYSPAHGGDRDLNPLLSLPELAVFLQSSVIVLFELIPQGPSLLYVLADRERTFGGRLGCHKSRLSSQSEIAPYGGFGDSQRAHYLFSRRTAVYCGKHSFPQIHRIGSHARSISAAQQPCKLL